MAHWQHDHIDELLNSKHFWVDNAGPLASPVSDFWVTRDERDHLQLKSISASECEWQARHRHPVGTVRVNSDVVSFAGHAGAKLEAIGVQPRRFVQKRKFDGANSCEEISDVARVVCDLRPSDQIAYTIDWLDNLQTDSGIWIGSFIKDESESVETRVFGRDDEIVLTRKISGLDQSSASVLHLTIGETKLYLAKTDKTHAQGRKAPGYVFYLGAPDDDYRTRIREVLSYCLGNHLIFLGSSFLSRAGELIRLDAVSPPIIGTVATIPAQPPSPLGDRYEGEVNQARLEQMANALLASYDALNFKSISWAYWHAICAPVHMKAAHFGAALESLQRAYTNTNNIQLPRSLLAKSKWQAIEARLLAALENCDLEADTKEISSNKIRHNLNQTPPTKLQDRMFAELGLILGDVERGAWKRRNQAAHGQPVDDTIAIDVIRETKLLKVIFHRMIMSITGANMLYYDEYTVGRPVRKLSDPVPS